MAHAPNSRPRFSAPIARVESNTINRIQIPIIFVPGVMGSRLHFTAINQHWDPDSNWRMLHWVRISPATARREMFFNQPARVISNETKGGTLTANEQNRGWEGVAWSFYVPYLRFLRQSFPAQCPVYAMGYDWRQNIADLGRNVATRIKDVLSTLRADKCIIVTHSMGGLVTRSACQQDSELSDKALSVIHVVQPVRGAPVLYRRFFTGARKDVDGSAMWAVLGNTGWKFAQMVSGLPGPLQLLPTNAYRDVRGQPWMYYYPWENRETRKHWTGAAFDLYRDADSPPGLMPATGTRDRLVVRNDLVARMNEASQMHQQLGEFKHNKTFAVYSTGVTTDMRVAFDVPPANINQPTQWQAPATAKNEKGELKTLTVSDLEMRTRIQEGRRNEGDGTVPSTSGGALFPGVAGNVSAFDESTKQYEVNGIAHDQAFNDAATRNLVNSMIAYAIAQRR